MTNLGKYLNVVYFVLVALTLGTIFGVLPQQTSFVVALIYIAYILFADTTSATSLVIRSIPIFIAIPFSDSFDNFNAWRFVVVLLFLKWGVEQQRILKIAQRIVHFPYKRTHALKQHSVEMLGCVFLFLTLVSVFANAHITDGIVRFIYIINAVLLFVVVRSLVIEKKEVVFQFCKDLLYGAFVVLCVGIGQFVGAYFLSATEFHRLWGGTISALQYGQNWSDIVLHQGNTWFSYTGDTLRLRMFSLFPDSHSFPIYLIMAIPAFFALAFKNSVITSLNATKQKAQQFQGAFFGLCFVLGYFAIILSGTRGIWLAALAPLALVLFLWTKASRKYSHYIFCSILVFVVLFGAYFGVISFKQFNDSSSTTSASIERITSVVSITELSNQKRITIWEKTLHQIQQDPVFGIGLANFALVLDEPLTYTLAGSSAHNIYLHIAATSGVLSALVFVGMIFVVVWRGVVAVKRNSVAWYNALQCAVAFALLWIMAYLMTDATLFDGRVLLGFMVLLGVAVGVHHATQKNRI